MSSGHGVDKPDKGPALQRQVSRSYWNGGGMDPARFSVVPMQYPPGHESGLGGHAGFGLSGEGNVQVTGSILGTQHQMKRFGSREAAHAYMAENRLQPTSFT